MGVAKLSYLSDFVSLIPKSNEQLCAGHSAYDDDAIGSTVEFLNTQRRNIMTDIQGGPKK